MADQDAVRRIALGLSDAVESEAEFAFRVNGRLFVWAWLERIDPRKARVPSRDVVVVRVASEMDKFALIEADPDVFFTEPHFDGYAAVMIRLANASDGLLAKMISDSYALQATKRPQRAKRG